MFLSLSVTSEEHWSRSSGLRLRRAEVFQAHRRQRKTSRSVFLRPMRHIPLWSKYYVSPGDTLLVRVGTLDHPEAIQPDVHIFTRSKVPWLDLPKDVPAFESFYSMNVVWSVQSKSGSVVMLPSKPDPSASRSVSGA
jgi:hypothetical protein